jgi:hypothetical protein
MRSGPAFRDQLSLPARARFRRREASGVRGWVRDVLLPPLLFVVLPLIALALALDLWGHSSASAESAFDWRSDELPPRRVNQLTLFHAGRQQRRPRAPLRRSRPSAATVAFSHVERCVRVSHSWLIVGARCSTCSQLQATARPSRRAPLVYLTAAGDGRCAAC